VYCHYWYIYLCFVSHESLPPKRIGWGWYSRQELDDLALRTRKYLAGEVPYEEWQSEPGIDPVWIEFLETFQLIAMTSPVPARTQSSEVAPTLTSRDFHHLSPVIMQDFLCEKIEWLRTRTKARITAIVDDIYAADQLHEQELVEFLLFAECKAKEHIACNA